MKLRNHQVAFVFMVLVSGFIALQMVIYLLHALLGFHPHLGFLHYCVAAFGNKAVLHSIINAALSVVVAYSLSMFVYIGCRQIMLERRWNNYVHANQNHDYSNYYNEKYKQLNQQIIVIEQHEVLALTSGFFRPKIILSSGLVSDFTDSEVNAIVLHEYSHCRNFDPLRMLLVKMMKVSFPFIPMFKRLSHYISVWAEVDADHFAVQYLKSPAVLASVLLKCSKRGRHNTVGIGFADEAINYRLLRLIEPNRKIQVPLIKWNQLAISVLALFILSTIVISGCS